MTTLKDLLRCIAVTHSNLENFEIDYGTIRTNSLACCEGDTFICIKGGKLDGHDFIPTAVNYGARLIICERVSEYLVNNPEIKYVVVKNTRLALAHMFNEHFGRPADKMTLVGVTGTNGKTSTTWFLRQIFKNAGYKTGVIGTVRCMIDDEVHIISDDAASNVNAMTTPEPEALYGMLRRMADAKVEIVFMEISSHSLMQHRPDPLKFTAGIFTGLSAEHLDYHKTMSEYYKAKRRLFRLCGAAVLNADDAYSKRLAREINIPYVTYSVSGRAADYKAKNLRFERDFKTVYDFCRKSDCHRIECGVAGDFMAANSLAAISLASLFGITGDVIARGIAECGQIPGRMEHLDIGTGRDFDVFIDYAHTPDALENVLRTLLKLKKPNGRLVVVFGCGGDRDKTKRPIMGRIATTLAGLTVITSDNSRCENTRAIIYDILRGVASGADYKVIEHREAAIRHAIMNHRAGDIILLAGKGHEDYVIDAKGKHPFNEKAIVFDALRALYNKEQY